MIYILNVLIEQKVFALNKPFYYAVFSETEINAGIRVEVNFHGSILIGYVLNVEKFDDTPENLAVKYPGIKFIKNIIDDEPIINDELFKVANYMSFKYVCPLISCLQAMLPKSLKPASSFKNSAKPQYFKYFVFKKDGDNLTKKQKETLEFIKNNNKVLHNQISVSIGKALLEKGLIDVELVEKYNSIEFTNNSNFSNFELTILQQKAYEEILNSQKETILLYGVTSSGKTEIYIKLIKEALERNQTALILVPEINLTPALFEKLNYYFNDRLALLTSGISDSERYRQYKRILKGDAKVVLGTRFAIFAPLNNLGIIIIDEEFSQNYKQDDSNPHYSAIEIARYRGHLNNCKVVLGSATPSLDSMNRAMIGNYDLVTLSERYNEVELPKAQLINMANIDNVYPGCSLLSKRLVDEIKLAINNNEKVMLLMNRKGYSNITICSECEQTVVCPNCEHPVVYNKYKNVYKCNVCGRVYPINELKCNHCDSTEFINSGIGIEIVEEQLKRLFPKETIYRLDTDIASSASKISAILEDFSKNGHILIGTEMIAKGHDFPDVSLAAVILADQFIYFPVYDVNERAFQILTQFIGRTGRKDKQGLALVQTRSPESFPILLATMQDYDLFFKKEMEYRKKSANPPYFSISTVKLSNPNVETLRSEIYSLKNKILIETKKISYSVYIKKGFEKLNGKYIATIVIKYKNQKEMLLYLNELAQKYEKDDLFNLNIIVDDVCV